MKRGKDLLGLAAGVAAVLSWACTVAPAGETGTKDGEKAKVQPALQGYCPACFLIDRKALKGDPKYQTKFRGRIYYHTSEERKKAFEEDPDKYLPQFDGLCTVALGGSYGKRIPGDPEVFTIEDGKVYFFSSLRAWRAYNDEPPRYRKTAEDRFSPPAIGGYCPVTYILHGQARPGETRFQAVYDGKVFYFMDGYSLRLFNEDPDKYLPAYDGNCAMAMAQKRLVKANPKIFLVEDGKTYLFLSEDAKKEFESNPKQFIGQANAAWKEMK